MKTYDAADTVLGRLGTFVAKDLLSGESVAIVNAERAVISGKPQYIIEKYMRRRQARDKADPEDSVKWPRRPDFLVKRILRGMLPYSTPRGRQAFKNLRVYIGVPEELAKSKAIILKEIKKEKLNTKFMSVAELCTALGYG